MAEHTATFINDQALARGKTFVWHEVYAPSSKASIDFYTKALDWKTQEYPTQVEGFGTYTMFVANGFPVAGVLGTSEHAGMEIVPPNWSTFIGVDDLDARTDKCKELGASVMHGPMEVPTVGRMVLLRDPQGAMFWLFQPEAM